MIPRTTQSESVRHGVVEGIETAEQRGHIFTVVRLAYKSRYDIMHLPRRGAKPHYIPTPTPTNNPHRSLSTHHHTEDPRYYYKTAAGQENNIIIILFIRCVGGGYIFI